MANTLTPEEAVERARRAQDQRIETVRVLAQTRQDVANERESADRERAELEARLKERMREVESADVKAFGAATAAGWTSEELRKIGFAEPDKKRRVRRRSASQPKQEKAASVEGEGRAPAGADAASSGQEDGPGLNV